MDQAYVSGLVGLVQIFTYVKFRIFFLRIYFSCHLKQKAKNKIITWRISFLKSLNELAGLISDLMYMLRENI